MEEYRYCPICGNILKVGIFNGKERKHCPHCAFINYKNPLPSVGAIAVKEDKVLLIKRGIEPGKGIWAPPSGFMELGETPEEAVLRELKEETGMSGRVKRLLGIYREITSIYGDILVIVYLVILNKGEIVAGDDAEDAKFFDIDKLPDLHFNCFRKAIEKINIQSNARITRC